MTYVLVALALCSCVNPEAVMCGGGLVCPSGTECRDVTEPAETVCALPEQIAACDGKAAHAKCLVGDVAGRCYDGVCIESACGNGRVDIADPTDAGDIGEICDDGKQIAGDGCSADCMSDEACGNGVPDSIAGEQCDDGNFLDHDGCDSKCLDETLRWERLDNRLPNPRSNFAFAYDATRREVVMFGGTDLSNNLELGDTWVWAGTGWTRRDPPGSDRVGHGPLQSPPPSSTDPSRRPAP